MVSIVSCAEGTPCVKETLISRLVTKSCTSTLLLICLFEEKSHRLRKKKKKGLFCSKTSRNDKDKHTGFHIYRNVLDYI